MSQLQAQIPDPLTDDLPGLLPPGGVRAPAIRVEFLILIGKHRFKSATMQVQFDDIAGGEALLRQSGEEEFVDHAVAYDANGTLLLASGVRGHDHAAEEGFSSHRDRGTIVEAAYPLAFRPLLHLIGRQVQARLHERMIQNGVLLAAGHEGEARQIGEDRSRAILTVQPQQGALFRHLVRVR